MMGKAEVEKKDGMIRVKTDYNAEFVKEIKLIPGRRWDADAKVWLVPDTKENEEEIERLVKKYFEDLESKVIKVEVKAKKVLEGDRDAL